MGYRKRGPKPKPLVVQVRTPLPFPLSRHLSCFQAWGARGGGRGGSLPEHPILSLPA